MPKKNSTHHEVRFRRMNREHYDVVAIDAKIDHALDTRHGSEVVDAPK